jgi:hypothetical protein
MNRVSILALSSLFFIACNSGEQANEKGGSRIPDSKHRILLTEKKVASFDNWARIYADQDSIRQMYHVGHYMAGRGIVDTNQIYVIDLISDSSKIDEYLSLPFIGYMRSRSGVIDSVVTHKIALLRDDTSAATTNDRLVVSFSVQNVEKSLQYLDKHGLENRSKNGFVDRGMGVSMDGDNKLYLFFAVPDWSKAEAFLTSPGYKEWLEKMGASADVRAMRYRIVM